MTELLTAAQMRAIEQAAINSGEVTGLELMERAGQGVVDAVLEEWSEMALAPHRAVVLCGPGNNGGDGFVVARLLKQRGWEVEVFLYGGAEKQPPDARVNYERWREIGEVKELTHRAVKNSNSGDLYVDAVFGTGLSRKVEGDLGNLLRYLAGSGGDGPWFRERLVSVDVPSGLDSDTGEIPGAGDEEWAPACPASRLVLTFHREKVGHRIGRGPSRCGKVVVRGIGLVNTRIPGAPELFDGRIFGRVHLGDALEKGRSDEVTHKYSHGHVVVMSGSVNRTGAARLAARGAMRIGAGLVTITAPISACQEHAAQLNAIMLREVDEAKTLQVLLEDTRINALCIGPSLGLDDRAAELVAASLAAERSTVLDADALTLLARTPELFSRLHAKCVLTPHGGEYARLFPDIAEKLEAPATKGPAYSKVDATREAAARAGCVVLFKGADTVIADPTGRCAINSAHYERSAPWLATAGSGDVLAGFITGLLARGFSPMSAAETAAWLHVECALKFGPGLIAEDLPEQLPAVFRDLGL